MRFLFTKRSKRQGRRAFTLVEMMIASALGTTLLAGVATVSIFGMRSFSGMANYVDLDAKSRNSLDVISREVRDANVLVSYDDQLPVKSLTLRNDTAGETVTFTYNSATGTLVLSKTGQRDKTLLTGCERWDFSLYQRKPILSSTNIEFYSATNIHGTIDPNLCKLINMSWKCVRNILGDELNTESVQTAQIGTAQQGGLIQEWLHEDKSVNALA